MAYVLWSALFSQMAWVHPEILGSSDYVWLYPGEESVLDMLRKVFDWKAFDPNVNRVRPMNDLFEVIDAMSRPFVAKLPGVKSSVAISTILMLVVVPLLAFACFRLQQSSKELSALFTTLFVSTTGYLSITVPYWHPAKRLVLLFTIATYLCLLLWSHTGRKSFFVMALSLVFSSFFSDELGYINFVIFPLIFWRSFKSELRLLALWGMLTIAFYVTASWLMPLAYQRLSVHGPWDALRDRSKFDVFHYLADLNFWLVAVNALARSFLSTFGIPDQSTISLAFGLIFFILTSIATSMKQRHWFTSTMLLALVICVVSTYATLLDFYPFPGVISYLGSFNYYYHSLISFFVVAWGVSVASAVSTNRAKLILLTLVSVSVILNAVQFMNLNKTVRVIHQFPYTNSSLEKVAQRGDLRFLKVDKFAAEQELEESLKYLYGSDWAKNDFYKTHLMLRSGIRSLFTESHLASLERLLRPW
jgi:hypothetical protein